MIYGEMFLLNQKDTDQNICIFPPFCQVVTRLASQGSQFLELQGITPVSFLNRSFRNPGVEK